MPRNVRAAWLETRADDGPERGTGPRGRTGFVSGQLTLRTAAGAVSEPITFDAGGSGDDGSARLALTIPAGYSIEIDGAPVGYSVAGPDGTGRVRIVARPILDAVR